MLPSGADTAKQGEPGWNLLLLSTIICSTSITFSLNLRNVQNISSMAVSYNVSGQSRAVPSDDFHGPHGSHQANALLQCSLKIYHAATAHLITDGMLLLLQIYF